MQECAAFHMQQNKLQSGWYKANNYLASYYQMISKRLFYSESDESDTSHKGNSENEHETADDSGNKEDIDDGIDNAIERLKKT